MKRNNLTIDQVITLRGALSKRGMFNCALLPKGIISARMDNGKLFVFLPGIYGSEIDMSYCL